MNKTTKRVERITITGTRSEVKKASQKYAARDYVEIECHPIVKDFKLTDRWKAILEKELPNE